VRRVHHLCVLELGVVLQDPPLKVAQLDARLEPESLTQTGVERSIDVERL
jgi:hypothetical protein